MLIILTAGDFIFTYFEDDVFLYNNFLLFVNEEVFSILKLFHLFYSDEKRGWFTSTTKTSQSTLTTSRITSRTTVHATSCSTTGVTCSITTVKRSSISTKVAPPPKKTSIWDIFTMDEN